MNTIFYSKRQELSDGRYVIRFSCSDIAELNIDTTISRRYQSESANKVLDSVADRITLALQKLGYSVESVNFWSMAITARKV